MQSHSRVAGELLFLQPVSGELIRGPILPANRAARGRCLSLANCYFAFLRISVLLLTGAQWGRLVERPFGLPKNASAPGWSLLVKRSISLSGCAPSRLYHSGGSAQGKVSKHGRI